VRTRYVAAALGVTAAALTLGPGSAPAAPPSFFGLVPNADLAGRDYELIDRANVGAARVGLSWPAIEPRHDRFDWRATDRAIGGIASAGITPLPLLNGNPRWLPGTWTKPPIGSQHQRREWAEFVAAAVARYGAGGEYWQAAYGIQFPGSPAPPTIDAWQVWNEENGPKHFHPRPSVAKYGKLLGVSAEAIERHDPGAEVLTGGMASKPTGKGGIDAWTYVRKLMSRKSTRRAVDHVALHPYARNERQIASHVKKMRRALKRAGKRRAQIWITELGWSSRRGTGGKLAKTAAQQAKLLKRSYRLLERKRRRWKIGGVYWYTWRDFRSGVCDWCPHAGLVTRAREPKPAYRKYRRVARG
jgi:Glycosyl hydrolase catalytic core